MKKRIIIGAIIIAALPVICTGETEGKPTTFFRFIEMTDEGEFKPVDGDTWLDHGSTLFILARGFYADYHTERPDGTVVKEKSPLWGRRGQEQELTTQAMFFSPDEFKEACKYLYPDLAGVEINDVDYKTLVLKDEAPQGENLVILSRLAVNEDVKFRKEFEVWRPGFLKFVEETGVANGETDVADEETDVANEETGSTRFKKVDNRTWLNLGSTLFLAVRGYNVQYQVIKKGGGVRGEPKTILWKDQITKPRMYVDSKFREFCKKKYDIELRKYEYATIDLKIAAEDGETLLIIYENASNPNEVKSKSFKVLRSRWAIVPVQSFSINTVFNYEIGKKKAEGGTGSGFSAGPGANVPVFYYRFPESKDWDKIGFALNFNVAPSEILNEETQQTENVYVWTGGGLFVVKFKASPVLLLLGYGYSLNGDDKYGKINFGFGAELTQ